MVAYNYSGEKILSAKMQSFRQKSKFLVPAILKEHTKSAFGSKQ